MVLIFGFPENYRTFGGIGLPVKADASLSVSIRRRTVELTGFYGAQRSKNPVQ